MVACVIMCVVHQVTSVIESEDVSYTINEEGPTDEFLGNILEQTSLQGQSFKFNYLSTEPTLFAVNLTTGALRTVGRVDREEVCRNMDRCMETFNIGVLQHSMIIQIIKVTITILDINDNAPRFVENKKTIEISESASTGSRYELPSVSDPDSPLLSVKRYEMSFSDGQFELKADDRMDGVFELFLETKGSLDRERKSSYDLLVTVTDGGTPAKTGTMSVTVVVLDANDNTPRFDQERYTLNILENPSMGSVILQVHASDDDEGRNKEIVYTMKTHKDLFGINNKTGEVYVKGVVDYEQEHLYHVGVIATDQGMIPRSTDTIIVIEVKDLNDNSPEITVNSLGAQGIAEILENAEQGTFVAHVKVEDKDSGVNGELSCTLTDNKFRLEQLFETNYQIVTSGHLDRERISEYSLAIHCVDRGAIPHERVKNVQVRLIDVNDNAPQFLQASYQANVVENNKVGDFVLQPNATDADAGQNAEILYSISENGQKMFAIDGTSGRITAKVVFDREENSKMQFHVIAVDRGVPAMSSSVLVVVTIQDLNDEIPLFTQNVYSFNVSENEPQNTEVGTVGATDADQFPFNEFLFSIVPDTNLLGLFSIDSRSGKITTKGMLDREVQGVFRLTVLASDYGSPIKSSRAGVVIYVTDQNDNTPVFSFPDTHNNTVHMSNRSPIGLVVAHVNANDLDIGDNGRLTYRFSGGNDNALFTIDQNKGDVSVNVEFKDTTYELHEFTVIAQDHGFPQKLAEATLNIFVNKSIPYPLAKQSGSILSGQNFSIAISLACVSAIVIVILVVAIVLIRRQEREKMQQYNCRMEALRKLTGKVTRDGKSEKESRSSESVKRKSKKLPYEIDFTIEKEDEKKQYQSDSKVSDLPPCQFYP